ncbi:MAG: hypothetical protein QGG40_19015, partial [Myxococcota bacterium]|nr:hypothetical protein [Myxococcota bacterium]
LDERVEGLDLSDMEDTHADQLRAVLKLMLCYEQDGRPSGLEVGELMESLSEYVNDGTLRKFCREEVRSCVESNVFVEASEDPLTGSTLFEDISEALQRHDSGPHEKGPILDEDATDAGAQTFMPDAMNSVAAVETESAPVVLQESPVAADPVPVSPPVSTLFEEDTSEEPAPSGKGKLVGVLVGLVAVAGVAGVMFMGEEEPSPTVSVTQDEDLSPGGTYPAAENTEDSSTLRLELQPPGAAKVKLSSNSSNFGLSWDGTGTLELTELEQGTIRARVNDGKGFSETRVIEVEAASTSCMVFKMKGGEDWESVDCD